MVGCRHTKYTISLLRQCVQNRRRRREEKKEVGGSGEISGAPLGLFISVEMVANVSSGETIGQLSGGQ